VGRPRSSKKKFHIAMSEKTMATLKRMALENKVNVGDIIEYFCGLRQMNNQIAIDIEVNRNHFECVAEAYRG